MSTRPPLAVRLLNRAGRAAERLGVAPPLTPSALKKQAQRRTGKSVWHGPLDDPVTFETGLELVCASVEAAPELNGVGRLALHIHLLRALSTRLMRVAEPVRTESLRGPVLVVVGLPRSGTTFLHRLLAHAPGARPLALWEVQHPVVVGRGPDRRRAMVRRQLDVLHKISPDLEHKHATAVDAPEECFFLLDDSLVSPSFPLLYPLEPYRAWRHTASVEAAYRSYRQHLLRFQAQTPEKRLVLKAPGHAEHLAAIAEAVPEARFVHTHRSPLATVPSRASLLASLHGRFTDRLDRSAVGQASLDDAVALLKGSQRGRATLPSERLFDVQYDDLIARPSEVAAAVHEWAGLPPDPQFAQALQSETRTAPAHRYALDDFMLSEAEIVAACAPYCVGA